MKISIIGMPASGKTFYGRKLANFLDIRCVDIDEKIEQLFNCSIFDYFDKFGEAKFRSIETEILKYYVHSKEDTIISTGGGIVLNKNNRFLLRNNTICLYMNTPLKIIHDRLQNDKSRFLLKDFSCEKLKKLFNERHNLYLSTKHLSV